MVPLSSHCPYTPHHLPRVLHAPPSFRLTTRRAAHAALPPTTPNIAMATRALTLARRAPSLAAALSRTQQRTLVSSRSLLEEKNTEYRKQYLESQDPITRPGGLGVTGRIPDDFEHATGLERKELLEIAKGNDVRVGRGSGWEGGQQRGDGVGQGELTAGRRAHTPHPSCLSLSWLFRTLLASRASSGDPSAPASSPVRFPRTRTPASSAAAVRIWGGVGAWDARAYFCVVGPGLTLAARFFFFFFFLNPTSRRPRVGAGQVL